MKAQRLICIKAMATRNYLLGKDRNTYTSYRHNVVVRIWYRGPLRLVLGKGPLN